MILLTFLQVFSCRLWRIINQHSILIKQRCIQSDVQQQMGCAQNKGVEVLPQSHKIQAIPQEKAPVSSATPLENGSKFDTVVVGGGIAGVAAAVTLAKAGQQVAVLEVNGFLGGRMKSTEVNLASGGTLQFDEGASWIHNSCKEHPITKLSKKVKGLVMKETDDDSLEVYDEQGNDVQKQADAALQKYERILKECDDDEGADRTVTLAEAFKKRGADLNDKYFMFHVSNDQEFQTSGAITNLSCRAHEDQQFDGDQMLILSGYQKFVETLATQANIQVYLNQKVKRVAWKQEESEITCAGGATIYAKNVVLAVPIGVLKARGIEFLPAFPKWKNQAIDTIGFGNVCKILVDFPDGSFVKNDNHYIGVVSDNINERGLGTTFMNLQPLAGIPTLMTFGLGDNADQAQKMPQNQLKAVLAKRMTAFSQQPISPSNFALYRTSWRSNPNFQGTYSYSTTKTKPQHWQNMAKPLFSTRWYFCGEHTTARYRGSVHGAYLSGVGAAGWVTEGVEEEEWVYPDYEEEGEKKEEEQFDD